MKANLYRSARLRSAFAAVALGGLVLAGCSDAGATKEDPGAGVAYGASKEEYRAAFADVEPITLRIQGDGPEGSLANKGRQAWTDSIEDWSGGKITFEWGYSVSFVPDATEWAAGLADGRMDVGNFLPYYTPEEFPKLSELADATFLDGNRPTAGLASTGWMTEIIGTDKVYQEEAAGGGIHVLALAPSFNVTGIFCTEERTSLGDFSGVSVSASGKGRFTQLAALGMKPTSIAFTELYEALQRGVVGCGSTVVTGIESIGATELVPHATVDPDASLAGFPAFLAMGKAKWDSLPLVAQQLLVDRLDVFLETEMKGQGQRNIDWLKKAQAAGGGITPFEDDARQKLLTTNESLLGKLKGTDTDAVVEAHDRWSTLINEKLYPDLPELLEEFLSDGGYADVDLKPFVDAMFDEVLLKQRPS